MTAPLEPELMPFEHARKCFRVDVRVSTPQLEDWQCVHSNELSLFDAQHLFRVWCRRIRRGTLVGREYRGSAVRIRFTDERGALTVVQWGEPGTACGQQGGVVDAHGHHHRGTCKYSQGHAGRHSWEPAED